MNIEERYEELVDRYACDDDSLLALSRMVAELEWQVEDLKRDIEDWKQDLKYAEGRIGF